MELNPLLEHLPFVLATGGTPQLSFKDLIGAITIGAISAIGSSMLTTKELSVEVRILTRQMESLQSKVDVFANQHSNFSERLTRIEAITSVNGGNKR